MQLSDIEVGSKWRSKHALEFIVVVRRVKPALAAAAGGGVQCVHEPSGFCQCVSTEDWLKYWEPVVGPA
jgi:hypothetical protein